MIYGHLFWRLEREQTCESAVKILRDPIVCRANRSRALARARLRSRPSIARPGQWVFGQTAAVPYNGVKCEWRYETAVTGRFIGTA